MIIPKLYTLPDLKGNGNIRYKRDEYNLNYDLILRIK
jgi:hypothetical protein